MKTKLWWQKDFVVTKQSSNKFGKVPDHSSMTCNADFHLVAWFIHTTNNPMQRTVLHDGNSVPSASPSKIDSLFLEN